MRLNKCLLNWAVVLIVAITCVSCAKDRNTDDVPEEAAKVVNVIVDTDLGGSADDLLALMMLYRYADVGKVSLMGVVVDRPGADYYAIADVLNTYYGYPDVPVGVVRGDYQEPLKYVDYCGMFAGTDKNVHIQFPRTKTNASELPDGCKLYRRLLAGADDGSVTIISIGFVLCLDELLNSQADELSPLSGVELVSRKVREMHIMGGSFEGTGEAEYNFSTFPEQCYDFLTRWPENVPVTYSPAEVGDCVDYPARQLLDDLAAEIDNPIKLTYQYFDCDNGQRMWDPMTVINAIEGDSMFTLSPWGKVIAGRDCVTTFSESAGGHQRYQMVPANESEWGSGMVEVIRRLNMRR